MCYNKHNERTKEITTMPALTYVALANAANATPLTKGETLFVIAFCVVALAIVGTAVYDFHKNF